jgi:proline dehydrogenase
MNQEKCPELPSYEAVRQANLAEIETYFNSLYGEYSKYSPTTDAPKVIGYEQQLDILSKELVNKLQDNLTATVEQHNIYMTKKKEVEDNRIKLRELKQAVKDGTITQSARQASYTETAELRSTNKQWHTGYAAINVILLLINLGIAVYLTKSGA